MRVCRVAGHSRDSAMKLTDGESHASILLTTHRRGYADACAAGGRPKGSRYFALGHKRAIPGAVAVSPFGRRIDQFLSYGVRASRRVRRVKARLCPTDGDVVDASQSHDD